MSSSNLVVRRKVLIVALCVALLVGHPGVRATELALTPERNPPGDIPDNQVFITYISPLGYSLQVPQGWARSETADSVVFADKFGRIEVKIASGVVLPPSAAAEILKSQGHAVTVGKIESVTLPAGHATRIVFDANSESDPVTNKRVRLESDRYIFSSNGKTATVTFSAPKGADNVDQWTLMSKSFKWL